MRDERWMVRIGIGLVSCLWAVSAWAQERPTLVDLLEMVDVIPERALIEATTPTPVASLVALAQDPEQRTYVRMRAVSLLVAFDAADVEAPLRAIAESDDALVRGLALWTLSQVRGADADAALVGYVAGFADDDAPSMRAECVRAMGWLNHPDATAWLQATAVGDDATLAQLAQRELARRETNPDGAATTGGAP